MLRVCFRVAGAPTSGRCLRYAARRNSARDNNSAAEAGDVHNVPKYVGDAMMERRRKESLLFRSLSPQNRNTADGILLI